jgi:hypothetical protein
METSAKGAYNNYLANCSSDNTSEKQFLQEQSAVTVSDIKNMLNKKFIFSEGKSIDNHEMKKG